MFVTDFLRGKRFRQRFLLELRIALRAWPRPHIRQQLNLVFLQQRDEFIDRPAFDRWYQHYRNRLLQEQIGDAERQQAMKAANPAVVLRNYLAQQAIDEAEKGESGALARLHQALQQPFSDATAAEYRQRPPDWGKTLEVSCSS